MKPRIDSNDQKKTGHSQQLSTHCLSRNRSCDDYSISLLSYPAFFAAQEFDNNISALQKAVTQQQIHCSRDRSLVIAVFYISSALVLGFALEIPIWAKHARSPTIILPTLARERATRILCLSAMNIIGILLSIGGLYLPMLMTELKIVILPCLP